MTDVLVLVAIAAVVGVAGIGAGILIARPLDRAMVREDEDDPDRPDGPERTGADAGSGARPMPRERSE